MTAKSYLPSFPNASTIKGSTPGEYLVCDIQGPFSVQSMGGERYVLTYTDYYTRHSWTYLLTQKSEALGHLKHLIEVIFAAARVELRHYHSDGAGELTGQETRQYLERTVRATVSTSEVYTPQRNSIAERKFRTLGEMTAATLHDSSLPRNFWGYAYLNATYLRNRIPITTRTGVTKTPHELWTGQVPNIRHIRRWGCKCYAHIPKAKRIKDFSYKSHIGYLIGYTNENGYLIYVPAERKVIKPTVAVVFDERVPPPQQTYFDELTKYDTVDVTDTSTYTHPDDFKYLVDLTYVDPDDDIHYRTTRIAIYGKDRHIVTYRSPILDDGITLGREEPTPVHAADVVRMVAVYNRIHVRHKAISEISLNTPDKLSDQSSALPVLPHPLSGLASLYVMRGQH